MSRLIDFFWPVLKRESDEAKRELNECCEEHINQIEKAHWDPIDPVLEQARVLALDEKDRRKTAETKASIYLAVLAAIVPLSATIVTGLSGLFGGWILVVLTSLFLISIAYLARAIFWIFGALQLEKTYRVDVHHLTKLKNDEGIKVELCKQILKSVRNNWDVVNDKLTNVKMAHMFIKRMLVSFVLLLILAGLLTIYPTVHEIFTSMKICFPAK